MTYRVILSRQAARYYQSVPSEQARRLSKVLRLLEAGPYPPGSKPLVGNFQGLHRIRVGHLRVIYEVSEDAGQITVIRIGPRGDAY